MPESYIICTTPRSGSTLLCDLLAAAGAGAPDSFFMPDPDPAWVREWGLPDRGGPGEAEAAAAFLRAAIRAGRGGTPVFGLRLMRAHLDGLSALVGTAFPGLPSDRARLEAAFGAMLCIHLARADKLAQAVSAVKAEQTGLWHVAPDGNEIERLAPPAPPRYDFARIASRQAELERDDAAWAAWFQAQGIAPLRIGYEELSANPAAAVARICTALGLPAPAPGSLRPGTARLADAVSADWMHRFRQDEVRGIPG